MSGMILWQPPFVRPSGIASGDGADLLAGAWARAAAGAQTQVDEQVRRQADVALDQVMARAPAAGAVLQANIATALAQGQRAVEDSTRRIAADALRQASAALIRAEPWLQGAIAEASATGGRRAADSGLAAVATQLAPYAIATLLVGVAVYLATEPRHAR